MSISSYTAQLATCNFQPFLFPLYFTLCYRWRPCLRILTGINNSEHSSCSARRANSPIDYPTMQNATVTTPMTLDASFAKSRTNVLPAKQISDSQTSNTTSSTSYNDGSTLQHPTSDNSQSTSGSNYTPASSQSRDTQVGKKPLESITSVPEASRNRPATPKLKTDWQPDRRENIPSTPSSAASDSPTHGSKRTASGAIKPPSSTKMLSPQETPNGRGHERHNSLSSSRSTVEEVSAKTQSQRHLLSLRLSDCC